MVIFVIAENMKLIEIEVVATFKLRMATKLDIAVLKHFLGLLRATQFPYIWAATLRTFLYYFQCACLWVKESSNGEITLNIS
jgi:hypothetical protein